jgi:hypothetical protein
MQYVLDAEHVQQGALLHTSGRGDWRRTAPLHDLDRRQPDPAGTAVDEHGFAWRHPGEMLERIIGGEKCDRDGRRRRRADSIGKLCHREFGHHHVLRKCRRRESDATLAGRQAADAGADAGNHAGALHADGRPGKAGLERFRRQQTERPHDVAEIETGRLDLDFHLTRARRPARSKSPRQTVQRALRLDFEARGLATRRGPGPSKRDFVAHDPEAVCRCIVDQKLAVISTEEDFLRHPPCGLFGRHDRTDVDQPDVEVRIFVRGDAGEAPQGRGFRPHDLAAGQRLDRSRRNQPQAAGALAKRFQDAHQAGAALRHPGRGIVFGGRPCRHDDFIRLLGRHRLRAMMPVRSVGGAGLCRSVSVSVCVSVSVAGRPAGHAAECRQLALQRRSKSGGVGIDDRHLPAYESGAIAGFGPAARSLSDGCHEKRIGCRRFQARHANGSQSRLRDQPLEKVVGGLKSGGLPGRRRVGARQVRNVSQIVEDTRKRLGEHE